jgi:hypothetical protein
MARIRSIHPELCTDETLVDVSAEAERTFIRLLPHLDDEGRALDNPKLLKASLYPLHDSITTGDLDGWLWELARHGIIIRYQKDGKRFLSAKPAAWKLWQKPRWKYESKYPAPEHSEILEMPGTSDVRPTTDRRTSEGVVVESRGDLVGAAAVTSDVRPTYDASEPDKDERQQRYEDAVRTVVERHLERYPSKHSRRRHFASLYGPKLDELRHDGFRLLTERPGLSAEELADLLEPELAAPPVLRVVASAPPASIPSPLEFHPLSCVCAGQGNDRNCNGESESA